MTTEYCIDDMHGTPCKLPCGPCEALCDPKARVEAMNPIDAMQKAGWDAKYIECREMTGTSANTPARTVNSAPVDEEWSCP